MSNEIELYSRINEPLSAIEKLGIFLAKSGMIGADKTEQGIVLAWECYSQRKSPVQIMREYHIIEGKLSDRADSMLAKFRAKGGKHKVIARTAEEAAVELEIGDQKDTFKLTWADAQKEPFVWMSDGKTLKKNWRTPRARMQTLWARVISDGVRTLAPEIVSGIYTPEEIEDTIEPGPTKPLLDHKEPKAANVVDVTPVQTPTPAAEQQQTTTAAPAEEKKFGPADVRMNDKGKLTVESIQALEKAIGEENAVAALEWLKSKGWITNSLADINVERARRILDKPEVFVGYVKGGKK